MHHLKKYYCYSESYKIAQFSDLYSGMQNILYKLIFRMILFGIYDKGFYFSLVILKIMKNLFIKLRTRLYRINKNQKTYLDFTTDLKVSLHYQTPFNHYCNTLEWKNMIA